MTIRIIKPGRSAELERVHKIQCRWCTCVFEFQSKDANLISDQRDGDYYEINCPDCKKKETTPFK